MGTDDNMAKVNNIETEIMNIMHMLVGIDKEDIEADKEFLSMGFDSLLLLSFSKKIVNKYGVNIQLDEFFTNYNTLGKLSNYISENSHDETAVTETAQQFSEEQTKAGKDHFTHNCTKAAGHGKSSAIYRIFESQYKIIQKQNEILLNIVRKTNEYPSIEGKTDKQTKTKTNYYVPYHQFDYKNSNSFDELQLKYIKNIENKYITLTKKSKENIQTYRNVYANARNSAGFDLLYKEMLYQIVAEEGHGSKLIDIDGNEIIDITMGFGVNLFGYGKDFILLELEKELKKGMPLGPMGKRPGEVAGRIAKLTGTERVFFCNSGTEANMFALRIARAISGKDKIVAFTGSYHGTYDGVLGLPSFNEEGEITSIPMAPGITDNAVKDLILLSYDSVASLEYLENHAEEIAGVLVETVQSRRPDLQPQKFLKSLREITSRKDIALIFDEVITGFRIAAGGAQEFFGIKADIVTYGKIAGGGMPIGIVAGSSKYLDSIDGGVWSFGDDSVPMCNEKKTYAAGTFCHHPMAMAAANAVLQYIEEHKDILYHDLNAKADRLIDTINDFFVSENIPFEATHFGSLMRFNIGKKYEIFYYGLLEKGIYIWEGRNCFLSTEHTDEDINKIIEAVKLTVYEMKAAHFFEPMDKESFSMSMIQQRLYSQIQIKEYDPFDIFGGFYFEGEANIHKMEECVNKIIQRHEMLRTKLFIQNGQFKQEIVNKWKFNIRYIEKKDNTDMDQFIAKTIKKLHLEEPPLIEALLIHDTQNNRKLLLFHFHHLAADGISMNVFVQEFSDLYNGRNLLPLERQYKDFVKWEEEYLTEQMLQQDKIFWMDMLSGVTCSIRLPYDKMVNDSSDCYGKTEVDMLDRETVICLKKAAADNNVSLFMLLLAVFNMMLHKISAEEDIAIVTPVSNRFEGGFDDCIGMFTNTIALSSHFNANRSFKEYLADIKANCTQSYRHLNYPFHLLINELSGVGKDLFNVMFVYENTDDRTVKLDNLTIEKYNYFSPEKEFDISVEMLEKDGEIGLYFSYKSALFESSGMRKMIQRFKFIVNQIIEDCNKKLMDIESILPDERESILNRFNKGTVNYPDKTTIVELFEEQVRKGPKRIALKYKESQLSYEELNKKSNILAEKLRKSGVGPDDFVAIVAERSIEMIIGIYAVLKAGGAYVPMDVSYPSSRIEYMIKDCGAKAVLVYQAEVVADIPVIDLSLVDNLQGSEENPSKVNNSSDVAYCIYTSGTTGNPKGVMVEHKNVVRLFFNEKFQFDFNQEDIWIMFHSYCFDFSVWEMYGATLFGGKLIIISKEEAQDSTNLMNIIKEESVTILNQVPSAFYNLLEADYPDNKLNLRYLIFGGEALNPGRLKQWREWHNNIKIVNMYGITETTVHVTYREISSREIERGISDIGKPIPTLSVYIMNGNSLCGIGIPGELCVAGEGVARGYLNRKELTDEKFVTNVFGEGRLYRSGDLARWMQDGNIEYLGRIDEQIKVRGFRIELGEIESALRRLESVKDAVAILKKDDMRDNYICAYIISDKKMEQEKIKILLLNDLPEYMIPSYIMQIDRIPMTKNGKLDRKALPNVDFSNKNTYIQPVTKNEELICNIFSEVLGCDKVGVTDRFFEIGGHSLRATRVMNRIEEATGVKLPVKMLFQYSSAKELALLLEERKPHSNNIIPNVMKENYYEMSPAQKRIYLIWQMDKDGTAYNMPKCYKVKNGLDHGKIQKTVDELVKRHEILRTQFLTVNERPVQRINEDTKINVYLEFEDNYTDEEIVRRFIKPFDLEKDALFRVQITLKKEYSLLMFDIHHIINDGMSICLLMDDFGKLYNNQILNPLTHQYKDYSKWINANNLEVQKAFWTEIYQENITVLDIPCDYERPQVQSYRGRTVSTEINEETLAAVKALSVKYNATEYMLLLSVLMVTLSKYSRQEEIIVGTPVSGRIHKETENMLGMFVNILAIKGCPSEDKRFDVLLAEISEFCIKAYDNQEYPFEELVQSIHVVRDMSRNPLFDVMFAMQNNEQASLDLHGVDMTCMEESSIVSKYDLTFNVNYSESGYLLELEYCSDLYKQETAINMLKHFQSVLEQILLNETVKISEIKAITKEEEQLICKEFNNTYVEYPRDDNVITIFESQVLKTPEKLAVEYAGISLTYEQLNIKANTIAAELKKYNIKSNDHVAFVAERNIQSIVIIYGILKAGAAYVPLDMNYPRERIDYILKDCKPKVIIADELVSTDFTIVSYKELMEKEEVTDNPQNEIQAQDTAYVIYTSGTTGRPKGVLIAHRSILRLVIHPTYVELNENTVILQAGSISFDASTFEIHGALLNGGSVSIAQQESFSDVFKFKDSIAKNKVNTLFLTVMLFNQLTAFDAGVFDNIKYLMVGGEALNEKYVRIVQNRKQQIKFMNIYGPTETTTFATSYNITAENYKTPIGKPIGNTYTYIMNGSNLCGIGVKGELCIAGDGVSKGYLNDKILTDSKFVKNAFGDGRMYRTGDLVRWLPDGSIEFLGRIDEQVKIRGFRIELDEIAHNIRQYGGIRDAAVIVRNDNSGDKAIYAYFAADDAVDLLKLHDYLKNKLPDYMIPSHMKQIDKIPVTQNGKIDKKALPSIEVVRSTDYTAPENNIQKYMCEIFENVLNVNKVGIRDNFLEIGGDSIKAIRAVSKIRNKGYTITFKDIMILQTIERIANTAKPVIDNNYDQNDISGIVLKTPIIHSFEKWQLANPNYFNQAVLFEIQCDDKDIIIKALTAIVKHHDMLRAIYHNGELEVLESSDDKEFDFYEYHLESDNAESLIQDKCSAIQRSIQLDKGPLVKAALLRTNDSDMLFLCIHHLVVDGISWRILLEDFDTAVKQLNEGIEVQLPAKTASFIEWSKALCQYKDTDLVKAEETYWNSILKEAKGANIKEIYECNGSGCEDVELVFDEVTTDDLLYKANKTFNTEINDLLLSALAIAVNNVTEQNKLLVGMEGHGRELIAASLNIDRTVGWFTCMYPVITEYKDDIKNTIITVKEMLRGVPQHGIGYGLLHDEKDIDIGLWFNYLGHMDAEFQGKKDRSYLAGPSSDKNNIIPAQISMNGSILENRLRFTITFNRSCFHKDTIQMLVENYKEALIHIIDYCTQSKEKIITKSDIANSCLQVEEFDDIMNEFS